MDGGLAFEENDLVARLAQLPSPYVQLFAASCGEALQQAYIDFHQTTGQGDAARLRAALETAWTAAHSSANAGLDAALRDSEVLIPEEDDAWVDASATAQCAAAAVFYALRYAQDHEIDSAVASAEQEYQAADQAVLYELDADEYTDELEREVLGDARVQQVLRSQQERLRLLEDAAREGLSVEEVAQRLRPAH